MSDKPRLRLVVDNGETDARSEATSDTRTLDLFLRLRAVAPDPAGDRVGKGAIWLLLGPPRLAGDGATIH